jgi:hypothetical protein
VIRLTKHAVERYHERVKPALPAWKAKRELEAFIVQATELTEAPSWHLNPEPDCRHFEIADGICAVVRDEVVTTVVVRGNHSDRITDRQRDYKRKERARRAHKRRKFKRNGRPDEGEPWPI